jgi:Cellulase (glycosyl hydrolase family 5)
MKTLPLLVALSATLASPVWSAIVPTDLSGVRGFNYTPALVEARPRHHIDHWVNYDPKVTDFDLDLAVRLRLNQCRVFVPFEAWREDQAGLAGKLQHFVRACDQRGIGVMIVVGYQQSWTHDPSTRGEAREWAQFLVHTLSDEPGLKFWDVINEPDWPTDPERVAREFEYAKFIAKVFHELDPKTPVTIGMAFVPSMEQLADYVDVLSFHDYTSTRHGIDANIERAKAFATKVGKPVFNTEMGCIARANPYDIALEEHMDAHVGWYIWELMIVRNGWGPVHGVFYEDGTVRDPAIAAAILGFLRNRGPDILPAVPDAEERVTKVVEEGRAWLAEPNPDWDKGSDIAEAAAYLIESAELAPMHVPPTQRLNMLQRETLDPVRLRALLEEFLTTLEPYRIAKKPADA